ncbi:MAG TPA: alpha/beta hydrolase [Burkholderiales bacterium]|nr:alpha/beta hydrolase [Burkholderiales bacterium]
MKQSESVFVDVRGLRYHLRCWGDAQAPKLFLLHGWMDVSASFQFLVDALRGDWRVVAPDWRGYGRSQWSGADGYWFPDYLGDLDGLLRMLSPGEPATLVGHSMGGNVACLYAGARGERVAKLVNLEGFGLRGADPGQAPARYAEWLDELAEPPRFRDYASFAALAARLQQGNSRLTHDRALFLAEHWGMATPEGRVVLRSDPAHKRVNPVLYRIEEAEACWRKVTAPVLWIEGAESQSLRWLRLDPAAYEARKGCFATLVARTIPDAGHMLHHDQPQRLASAIEEFLLS